jgi:hypothetical protein
MQSPRWRARADWAEFRGCGEVDDQLEFGPEFDRQVAGLFAFENPAISIRLTWSVADQATKPQPRLELQDASILACDLNATVATKVRIQSVFCHERANPVFDDLYQRLFGPMKHGGDGA